jgi:putative DNA methylase
MAIVAEGNKGRLYFSPNMEQINAVAVPLPDCFPNGVMFGKAADQLPLYGYTEFKDLFTNRQLVSLMTFSELAAKAQEQVIADGGSKEYAQALCVYLSFAVDRMADFSTSFSRWAVTNQKAMNLFSKQAIPMTWDYPEVNVFADSVGGFMTITEFIAKCINTLPAGRQGNVTQQDAQTDNGLRNIMVSTDPPYYDNICYADLSDFFYIWL